MPSLTDLTTSAPLSSYIATLFVDVLEAAPRSSVVGFAVDAIVAWAAAHGADSGFWVSRDLGTRIANWLADRLSEAPEAIPSNRRPAFVGAVDCMVRAGVSAARGLEERLSGAR